MSTEPDRSLRKNAYVTCKCKEELVGMVMSVDNKGKATVVPLPVNTTTTTTTTAENSDKGEQQVVYEQKDLVEIDVREAMWKRYTLLEGKRCLKNKSDFEHALRIFESALLPWCGNTTTQSESEYSSYEDALVSFVKRLMFELKLSMQDACSESRRVFSAYEDIIPVVD